MAILKQDVFKTITDLDELKKVLHWFDTFQGPPIPQTVWLQCQLALIEGFTNAVRHAHKRLPASTPIIIKAVATHESLDIKIWDQGPGFDFGSTLNRKLKTTTADSVGGRGLRIMRQVADTVEYLTEEPNQNCLHICKYFSEP
ncbi:MAG: ATP-binding protein [Leptolyngbya sp. RL_3_1]|nr:ATP-binding protein [Leptolyngbya sp. RL_3_1]